MGWWSTNKGGYSFTQDDLHMLWGDGPADALEDAIIEIDKQFIETTGRPATTHELVAGIRFSYSTIHVRPYKNQERTGYDSRDETTVIDEAEFADALHDPKWAAFCQTADEYIKSVDDPQPAVVDHSDLLEVCQAAEAWAAHLRMIQPEDNPVLSQAQQDTADRIDEAIASARRTAYGAAKR